MEAQLHEQICDYLRLQYPAVIYRTDFAAGIKMTIGQASRHKRLQSGRAFPDLFIAEPAQSAHGMFLELKRDGTRIWLKDGSLTKDKHIQEQMEMLVTLRMKGYNAQMVAGFEQAKEAIDRYLSTTALTPGQTTAEPDVRYTTPEMVRSKGGAGRLD